MRVALLPAVVVATLSFAGCPEPDGTGEGEGEGEELPACAPRVLGPTPSTAQTGVLVVLAGEGGAGFVDGDAPRFNGVGGIGAGRDDGGEFVVLSDIFNGTLRRIGPDGRVSTVLGVPLDVGAVDGVCDEVRLNGPRGLAVDPRDGTVWFGDGPCLRHADLDTGETTTVAGDCVTSGNVDVDGGDLLDARFGFLFHDVEVDPDSGRVYIADRVNDAVRVVDVDAGTVSTLADGFDGPGGMALDAASRTLYLADTFNNAIMGIDIDSGVITTLTGTGAAGSADGPAATATLDAPQALALQGDRLVFGGFDGRVRALDLIEAEVTTLAEDTLGFFAPFGTAPSDDGGERVLLADLDGGLLVLEGDDVSLLVGADRPIGYVDGPGPEARFALPASIVKAPAGDAVLVSDSFNNAIRVVQLADGATTTLLGAPEKEGDVDGPFADAELAFPSGLAIDAAGTTLYVSATGASSIKKLDLVAETMETIAEVDDPWEVALDEPNNKLYVISSELHALLEIDLADNALRTVSDGFTFPIGVAVVNEGGASRVFVSDNEEHVLVEVDVDDGAGTVVLGTPGFQGPASGAADVALLSFPSSLHVAVEDGDPVLYIAETGGQIIRRVTLGDFASTFVVGDARLSGALPAGARVELAGAPILNPQDVVVVDGDIVIAGDTTIVVARP